MIRFAGNVMRVVLNLASDRSLNVLSKVRAIAAAGSASLIAMALLLAPAFAQTAQRNKASRPSAAMNARPIGAFTPAVSDPRLAAALARRGTRLELRLPLHPGLRLARAQPRRPRRGPRARRRRPPKPRATVIASLGRAGHRDHARAPTISASRSAGGASPCPATSPRPRAASCPAAAKRPRSG